MVVVSYMTSSGGCPVDEFITEAPAKAIDKIFWIIERFKISGINLIRESHGKFMTKVENDIYELKVEINKIFYRILLVIVGAIACLLNGFKKKTNKLPLNELNTARQRAIDFKQNINLYNL